MKYLILAILAILATFITSNSASAKINEKTKVTMDFSFTPSFKNLYDINLLETTGDCTKDESTKHKLPKGSKFRESLDYDAQTATESIIHVYEAPAEDPWFSSPFKLCKKGINEVQKSNYKRIGGVSTGLMVVPFKLRSGDLYSDSAIGPYISYKLERFELLAIAGLSQISVSEIGTEKVESKTGITVGGGFSFEVAKDWDVAIIFGADHLSGDLGETWAYQDKMWVSFAIGFNFTR